MMPKLIAKILDAPPTFASIGQDIALEKGSIKLVVASHVEQYGRGKGHRIEGIR